MVAAGGDPPPPPHPSPSADQPTSKSGRVRPPGPRPPPRPDAYDLYCPYQPTFKNIKVHFFDVARGINGYLGSLDAVWHRRVRLSPFTIHGIPVTPLVNPVTGFSSHFIIRLIDSRNPRYEVDLLFRDSDMYFVGFRRNLVLTKEEEADAEKEKQDEEALKRNEQGASSSKKNKKEKKAELQENQRRKKKKLVPGWGKWFCFLEDDMVLPGFFDAESCGVSAGYESGSLVTVGGLEVFEHMLQTFGQFQDGRIAKVQLQLAVYRVIIMFCEAMRLRTVWRMVTKRLVEGGAPYEIPVGLWPYLNNWTQLGRSVLECYSSGCLNLNSLIPPKHRLPKLSTYHDLIGDPSECEIRLINHEPKMMGYTMDELVDIEDLARTRNIGPGHKSDVRF